jgi:hypothetical protein
MAGLDRSLALQAVTPANATTKNKIDNREKQDIPTS